jgi:hypothetical protein
MKPAILFIEDNPDYAAWNREFMKRHSEHFDGLYAANREEAMQQLKQQGNRIMLMFCDMYFPNDSTDDRTHNNGRGIIKYAHARHPRITVVATSTNFDDGDNGDWVDEHKLPALSKGWLSKEAYMAKLEKTLGDFRLLAIRGVPFPLSALLRSEAAL